MINSYGNHHLNIGSFSCLIINTHSSISGFAFCLLIGVSSDYAQSITGQVTEVTCPVIGRAQPGLTLSKRQKTDPGFNYNCLTVNLDTYPDLSKKRRWGKSQSVLLSRCIIQRFIKRDTFVDCMCIHNTNHRYQIIIHQTSVHLESSLI